MSMKNFAFIFYLSIVQNVLGNFLHDIHAKQTSSLTDFTGYKNGNNDVDDEISRRSNYKGGDETSIETGQRSHRNFSGHKRSVFPHLGYDSRMSSGLKIRDLIKRTSLGKDYASKVNDDKNIFNFHEQKIPNMENSADVKDGSVNIPFENREIKSVHTETSYDSRHARNGTDILDLRKLIGSMATVKGKHWPFFRYMSKDGDNDKFPMSGKISAISLIKRFGIHEPMKRSFHSTNFRIFTPQNLGLFKKRISSDFGYGSREQVALNLALDSIKENAFGIYGPGKRLALKRSLDGKGAMDVDSGYGSRIQAASQIANDLVVINELYGLFGPGRK